MHRQHGPHRTISLSFSDMLQDFSPAARDPGYATPSPHPPSKPHLFQAGTSERNISRFLSIILVYSFC